MRIHGGLGWGTLSLGARSDPAEDRKSSFEALSPFTSVDIGSPLVPNWILHGGIGRIHALNASDKNKTYPFSSYDLRSMSMGITHYLMPYNAYVSLQYRFLGHVNHTKKQGSRMRLGNFTEVEQTFDSGKGLGITLGKEWWLNPGWAIGLSFIFFQDSLKGKRTRITTVNSNNLQIQDIENVDNALSTYFGLVLSASYN